MFLETTYLNAKKCCYKHGFIRINNEDGTFDFFCCNSGEEYNEERCSSLFNTARGQGFIEFDEISAGQSYTLPGDDELVVLW